MTSPIDCDVHSVVVSPETLAPYLERHWHEYLDTWELRGVFHGAYPPGAPTSLRRDLRGGPPAGASLATVREHVLPGAELAIVSAVCAVESIRNPDLALAVASAVNDWHVAEWLEAEPRLRAAIAVPAHFPELAAHEIDRVGGHPGFVQVALPVRAPAPYGSRVNLAILEAANRNGLTLGLHFGGLPGNPPTASGWPSWYLEEYAGMAQAFQTQLLSLIAEGAFERFPGLRVVLVESGFAWLPAFLWRLEKEWRGLRREVPWVRRHPGDTVREHVRITMQPNDWPLPLGDFLDQVGSPDLLMYASDYPHGHAGDALPGGLEAELQEKLLAGNARTFYALGDRDG